MTTEWSGQNDIASTDETIVTDPIPRENETTVTDPIPRESAEPIGENPTSISGSGVSSTEFGAPARSWIYQNVAPALLEGMRYITREKPTDPVSALGKFLIEYSEKNA